MSARSTHICPNMFWVLLKYEAQARHWKLLGTTRHPKSFHINMTQCWTCYRDQHGGLKNRDKHGSPKRRDNWPSTPEARNQVKLWIMRRLHKVQHHQANSSGKSPQTGFQGNKVHTYAHFSLHWWSSYSQELWSPFPSKGLWKTNVTPSLRLRKWRRKGSVIRHECAAKGAIPTLGQLDLESPLSFILGEARIFA